LLYFVQQALKSLNVAACCQIVPIPDGRKSQLFQDQNDHPCPNKHSSRCRPLHSSAYFVRLYLPVKFQASPPVPLPELNLHPDRWSSHCIAVRSFSGYAQDQNVIEEAEELALSLRRSPWANSTNHPSKTAYSIAQYNNPYRVIGRVNEVWFDVDCKANGVETY
jgi:hypothetical protein